MSRLPHLTLRPGALRRVRQLAARSVREFRDDHCPQMAAAISYHVLFSIFPLAIVGVGVLGLVARSPQDRTAVVDAVLRQVPLTDSGTRQLHDLITSVSGRSGALGLLGLLGVLWSASGMMAAVRTSLNVAWDTDIRRPFLRGKVVDLALIASTTVFVGLALALTLVTSVARQGAHELPSFLRAFAPLAGAAVSAGAFVGAVAVLFATFAVLYRFVPAVPTRWREVWPGALVAALAFQAVEYGFSVYVAHFAHYNKVYGSLGAVVAFLFFVYLASAAFLFGAEVASEYPRLDRDPPSSAVTEGSPG